MNDQSAEGFTRLQPNREDYEIMKRPVKSGFEMDAIWARNILKIFRKAGVSKKAKRQCNRRERREAKKGTRYED